MSSALIHFRSGGNEGDAINLDLHTWLDERRLNCRSGRWGSSEERSVHFIHCVKIRGFGEEDRTLDDVSERRAAALENTLNVLQDKFGLVANVTEGELVGRRIDGALPGNIKEISSANYLRVGALRTGCIRYGDSFNRHELSCGSLLGTSVAGQSVRERDFRSQTAQPNLFHYKTGSCDASKTKMIRLTNIAAGRGKQK